MIVLHSHREASAPRHGLLKECKFTNFGDNYNRASAEYFGYFSKLGYLAGPTSGK